MDRLEDHARRVVARLSDNERAELAVAAYRLLLAEEASMADLTYRARVRDLLAHTSPTFARALEDALTATRRVRYGLSPEMRTS